MLIRSATLEDINWSLLDFYQENVFFHYQVRPDYFFDGDRETCKQFLEQQIKNQTFLLLEDDSQQLVGFLYYFFKNEGKKILWISELFVAPSERKKGYGKYLINAVKKIAKENGCVAVELACRWFNQNALAMYQHIGMKIQKVIFETDLNEE